MTLENFIYESLEEVIGGKKIYTCGIISVKTKILVGMAMGKRYTAELAKQALEEAIAIYGAPYMVMTDRGSAFTSKQFYDILQEKGIQHSMSRPHTPIDNRFIETFWTSLKIEIGKVKHLNEQTYTMVMKYYVYYYNHLRPHSSLNYETPMESYLRKNVI